MDELWLKIGLGMLLTVFIFGLDYMFVTWWARKEQCMMEENDRKVAEMAEITRRAQSVSARRDH